MFPDTEPASPARRPRIVTVICTTAMRLQHWLAVAPCVLAAACGGGTEPVGAVVPTATAFVSATLGASTLPVRATTQATATTTDASGTVLTGRIVTWTSSNAPVATVNGTGLVTAVSPGTASITATSEGKSGAASLTVTAAGPTSVATVVVTLGPLPLPIVGQTTQASAILTAADGSVLTGRVITWTSSNAAVATVSGTGLVTAVSAGTASITARSEGQSGSATITVASSVQDVTPPTLTGLAIAPRSINVSTSSASVLVTAVVTDAGSGVQTVVVNFTGPAGTSGVGKGCTLTRVSGTAADGTWSCMFNFSQVSPTGAWPLSSVAVTDATGNTRSYETAALTATGFPSGVSVSSEPDFTPPTLVTLAIAPSTIDVARTAASIVVTANATDAVSGVKSVSVSFVGPPGTTSPGKDCSLLRVSGTAADGAWSCSISFAQGSAAGTWPISSVNVTDLAGNTRAYDAAALTLAGLPSGVLVTSPSSDVTPPALLALAIAPTIVNVATTAVSVVITAIVADAGSGVRSVQLDFVGPAGTTGLGKGCNLTSVGGTIANGTWTCTVTFAQGSPTGTWPVSSLGVTDIAGNTRLYDAAALAAASFPGGVLVTSPAPDVLAPALVSLAIAPGTIRIGTTAVSVEVTANVTDAGSGVQFVSVNLGGPSGSTGLGKVCNLTRASGTAANGTWSCALSFAPGSPTGTWPVSSVGVIDAVGNSRSYDTAALTAAGFANRVTVTP